MSRARPVLLILAGLAALTLAVVMTSLAANDRDGLLRTGERVAGVVVDVSVPLRGPVGVQYSYTVDERQHVGFIRGFRNDYEVGQRLFVYVDPDDPEHATLPGELPQSLVAYVVTILSFCVAVLAFGTAAGQCVKAVRTRR